MGKVFRFKDIKRTLDYLQDGYPSIIEELIYRPYEAFCDCVATLNRLKRDSSMGIRAKRTIAGIIAYYQDLANERLVRLDRLF